jgi:hypothetical protein
LPSVTVFGSKRIGRGEKMIQLMGINARGIVDGRGMENRNLKVDG